MSRATWQPSKAQRNNGSQAVVQFVRGGFFGLAMLWATGKLPLSVEDVNTLFRRLAMPGVKAVLL
jgi:hypothetical protein